MSVVDRVRKLIALAASSSEEEARTSAWLACKLIRENKLRIVDTIDPVSVDFADFFRDVVNRAEATQASWTKPRAASVAQEPAKATPPSDRRRIKARYASQCRSCRKAIAVGDDIYWSRESGTTHARCA